MRNFINKKAKNVREGRFDKPVEKIVEIVEAVIVNSQVIEPVKVEPDTIEMPKKKKKKNKK